jgi:hypothetical protein
MRKYVETTPGLSDIFLPELLDFLDFDASWFHMNDTDSRKLKYPTPRAWEDASRAARRVIKEYEEKGLSEVPHSVLLREFQKNVGIDAGRMFLDFYKIAKDIPVKELTLPFTDPDRAPIPSEYKGKTKKSSTTNRTDYEHAFLTAILRKSTELPQLTSKEVCNFARWMKRANPAPELGSMVLSSFFEKHPHLQDDYDAMDCLGPLADEYEVEIGVKF